MDVVAPRPKGRIHGPLRPSPWRALFLFALLATLLPAPLVLGALEDYDAAIDRDASAGVRPVSRSRSALSLNGRDRVPWNFGSVSGDATLEFILQGDPGSQSAYLAVGANVSSNLRFAQWPGTGLLGFTQLGVADYTFTPRVPSPATATHVAFVWIASQRTMRLYRGGVLAGSASGIDAGFAMPSGAGWLGSNPGGTEAMTGILHRLTVYDDALSEATLRAHADAWAGIRPQPRIRHFTADRVYFTPGDPVLLSWEVEEAERVRIDPVPGEVTSLTQLGRGSIVLHPAQSLALTLTITHPLGTASASLRLVAVTPARHPVLSEIVADDRSVLADEDGEFSGWVEIFNPTSQAFDLTGATLSDDPGLPEKWTFPARTLAPRESLVVFASGKNRSVAGRPLHASFRLANAGEYLALTGPHGAWQHAFAPAFPALGPDAAYGLRGGDPATAGDLPFPSPGQPNPGAASPPRPVLVAPASQLFTGSVEVTLRHSDPDAEIRFTLDGSDPAGVNAQRYSSPLNVTRTTRLRTVAVAQGLPGPPAGASYVRLAPELAQYTSTLPLLVIENFGAGPIPQKGWNSTGAGIRQVPRQTATWAAFERTNGVASLAQPPQALGLIGIRGRGAYSSTWQQKPYSVEAVDDAGDETEIAPLGMPAHSDWVLYYPDPDASRDPTLLFNTLAYDLSRSFGQYAVRYRWVEAFINEDGGDLTLADRRGVYALLERVSRGRDRLDFQRLSADGTRGGWLLNINRMDPEPEDGWPAANGATQPWFFHTAGPDRVAQSQPNTAYGAVPGDDQPQQPNAFINFDNPNGYAITPAQRASIEGWFRQFEDVLYQDNLWRDPARGYRRFVEVRNFIDYFVLNTLTRNGDGLLISIFPWKGDDDRLRIGPAWDYNWAAYYVSGGPTGDLLHRSDRLWYPRLFADPDFFQDYVDRWWELRAGPLANASMNALVDRQAAEISPAKALLNGLPSASEWTRRLTQLKSWLRQRADWMDTQFLPPPRATPGAGTVPAGTPISLTATSGTLYYTTDGTDPRASGGTLSPTARAYSSPIPVDASTRILARSRQGTRWSGLLSAQFQLPQDLRALRLSELMYHPSAFGSWTEPALEFLELHNAGAAPLDLGGLAFSEGIRFTFPPDARLEPGARLVLGSQPDALRSRYPGLIVYGAFVGQLDNAGEALQLTDSFSNVVLRLTYDDRAPWPTAADGTGRSLVPREDPESDPDPGTPAHWRASTAPGGSPGAEDPPVITLHPLDQETVPGAPVTLSVAVHPSASRPLQVRWRRQGVEVAPPSEIHGAADFLRIPTAPDSPATYQAVVSNAEHPLGLPSRVATVLPLADGDADGLPDAWEVRHGFDPARSADAAGDTDRDGAPERAEFLAGTDPTDPRSAMRLEITRGSGAAPFELRFVAQAGRTYALEASAHPDRGEWRVVEDIPAEASSRVHALTLPAPGAAQYLRLVTPHP